MDAAARLRFCFPKHPHLPKLLIMRRAKPSLLPVYRRQPRQIQESSKRLQRFTTLNPPNLLSLQWLRTLVTLILWTIRYLLYGFCNDLSNLITSNLTSHPPQRKNSLRMETPSECCYNRPTSPYSIICTTRRYIIKRKQISKDNESLLF